MNPVFFALVMTSLISTNLHASNYAGQEKRDIKSLSIQNIEAIQQGKGWGMAKPAELNGYPGPRHVLDMDEALGLSPDQRADMKRLFKIMQAQAVAAGELYIEAERQLEQAFRKKDVNPDSLRTLIDASAQARADLRYVHLATHLKTIKRLSRHQVATYNQLRGYGADAGQHLH